MNTPYMKALKRPWCTLSDALRKKDTVMGTMGKTQGVRSMARPQRMASRRRAHSPPALSCFSGSPIALEWASAFPSVTENSYSSGKPHISSVQACQVSVPSSFVPSGAVTSCENTALLKKTGSPL